MKKITFLSSAIAAVLLAGSPAAKAVNLQLSAVTPLDTFTFDLVDVAFNTSTGAVTAASYLVQGTGTFGATSAFTATNGQALTLTSSEAVGLTTTTDTFTLSTPLNFLTSTTDASGNLINGLQFEVGDANSGGNPVNLLVPSASFTATGTVTYGPAGTPVAPIGTTTMPGANGSSYAFAESVSTSPLTTAASLYAFRTFTYTISYPTIVPEPSTWAMLGLGIIAGGVAVRRRQLTA